MYAPVAELNCAGQLHFSWRLTHEVVDSDAHQKSHTLIVIDQHQAVRSDGGRWGRDARRAIRLFFSFVGIQPNEPRPLKKAKSSRFEPACKA
jgi:hypothetical protein